jgi:hypothetical protein
MNPQPQQFLGLANALSIDADGWAVIPFGDSMHSGKDGRSSASDSAKPIIQRFDKPAALALVNDFKSAWGKIKRAVVGRSIFKGHPDAPRFQARFPDKAPRGTIADMRVTDAGLQWRPVLNEQGAADVAAGWSEYSPYWLCNVVGEENGSVVVSPFTLKSMGLVEEGNIPGLSLVNAAEDFSPIMKNNILKLLAAMGLSLAADASDTDIAAAADRACGTVATANAAETTLKTEKSTLETKVTTLTAERDALKTETLALANAKTAAEQEAGNLKAQLAAERRERAMLLANAAVTDGRLPAAERDGAVTALCNASDFAAEAKKLAERQKTLPTDPKSRELGKQRDQGRSRTVMELVNARMEKNPRESYEQAYAAVQRDPENAELFKAMKSPEIKTGA